MNQQNKRWVFTWNADNDGRLISSKQLLEFLNTITSEGVFQLEKGAKKDRSHYQGRFVLKGPRQSKSPLLKQFEQVYDVTNLTLLPEVAYDSTSYCEKSDTRIEGPWYVGLQSYKITKEPFNMTLRKWQQQLLDLMTGELQNFLEDRKVIWIQDPDGGNGKSTFLRYLSMNEKKTGLTVEKLPIDRPDRVRSAVIKLSKKKDIDLYMFDFTRTKGVDTHFEDLFEVIEDIKNQYVVDIMYGNFNKAILKPSMVIIFTNNPIREFKKYLSIDRWEPFLIDKSERLTYIDLSKNEDLPAMIPFEQYLDTRLTKKEPTFKGFPDLERKWMDELAKADED